MTSFNMEYESNYAGARVSVFDQLLAITAPIGDASLWGVLASNTLVFLLFSKSLNIIFQIHLDIDNHRYR